MGSYPIGWVVGLIAMLTPVASQAVEHPIGQMAMSVNAGMGAGRLGRSLGPAMGGEVLVGYSPEPGWILHADLGMGLVADFDLDLFCDTPEACDPPGERTGTSRGAIGGGATVYSDGGYFFRMSVLSESVSQHRRAEPVEHVRVGAVLRTAVGVEWWQRKVAGTGMVVNVWSGLGERSPAGDGPQLTVTFAFSMTLDFIRPD